MTKIEFPLSFFYHSQAQVGDEKYTQYYLFEESKYGVGEKTCLLNYLAVQSNVKDKNGFWRDKYNNIYNNTPEFRAKLVGLAKKRLEEIKKEEEGQKEKTAKFADFLRKKVEETVNLTTSIETNSPNGLLESHKGKKIDINVSVTVNAA